MAEQRMTIADMMADKGVTMDSIMKKAVKKKKKKKKAAMSDMMKSGPKKAY